MKFFIFIMLMLASISFFIASYNNFAWYRKIKEKKEKEFKLDVENFYKYFLSENMEEDDNKGIVFCILYFLFAILIIIFAFYSLSIN